MVGKLGESLKQGATGIGTIALAFTSLFAIALVTVHVIEPETNFGPVSLYSLGPFGFVMRTGFVVLDTVGTPSTLSGLIHSSAANVWSISAIVGILLFAMAFRQDGKRIAIGRLSRNLGIAAMTTYLGGFLGLGADFAAVQPRLFFALVVLWMSLVANQLRSGKLTNLAVLEAP